MFIGFFTSAAAPNPGTVVCMMGDVLVKRPPDGLCHKFIEDVEQFESMKFYDPAVSCTGATDNTCEPTWDAPVLNTTYKTKCTKTDSSDWTCKTPTSKSCSQNSLGKIRVRSDTDMLAVGKNRRSSKKSQV